MLYPAELRAQNNVSPDNISTCPPHCQETKGKRDTDLAENLAFSPEKDPDLAEIMKAWPDLSEGVKKVVVSFVRENLKNV